MKNKAEEQYQRIYGDLHFERSDLFETINQHFTINNVLYPGSNIHVTPSFHFPHVVYVDQAENTFHFFQNEQEVQQFIAANKTYKRTSYIRFLYQDFTKPLPILDNEYDLIIALFAGGIAASCERYLKKGGYLLTNNHNHNAEDAIKNPKLELESVILKKGKKYEFIKKNLEQFFVNSQKNLNPSLISNNPAGGLKYKENEMYFLFKKVKQ